MNAIVGAIHGTRRASSGFVRQEDVADSQLRERWQTLLARQEAATAVYQSPSFFDYLAATEGSDSVAVLSVRTTPEGPIAGVVPVQKVASGIPFGIGDRTFFTPRFTALRVLGSEPMVPHTREAHDLLFDMIARQYDDVSAIEMDAVSVDGFLWRYLFSSPVIQANYFVHVLFGVRDCHFVHVPSSIEQFRNQLGRKLRHNLERQERVLERHLGAPLSLTVLNREQDVPALMAALSELEVPGSEDWAMKRSYAAAARHGFLHCFVLRAGARVVGLAHGTKSKDTYRLHNLFYDKTLRRFSPGTALWQQVLRFLIQDATFKDVDLGYGMPVYPHRSINTTCKRAKVLLLRRTLSNRCLAELHRAHCAVVDFVKAIPVH
jgi:hypothetical protein